MNFSKATKEQQAAASAVFNDLLGWGEENLPDDWEFQICFRNGEAWVTLLDPVGNTVDFPHDDCNLAETMQAAVEYAKENDNEYDYDDR